MREQLRTVIGDVFGVAPADVPDDASPESMSGWDSLRHLELMLALEMEFDVRVETDSVFELVSAEAIEEFLRDQGVPAS